MVHEITKKNAQMLTYKFHAYRYLQNKNVPDIPDSPSMPNRFSIHLPAYVSQVKDETHVLGRFCLSSVQIVESSWGAERSFSQTAWKCQHGKSNETCEVTLTLSNLLPVLSCPASILCAQPLKPLWHLPSPNVALLLV